MNVTEMTEMVTIDDRRPSSTKSHLTKTTGNNEWYTPDKYIEAARQAMGSIDCDPASSAEANEVIRAATYYTQDDDGRQKPWSGNVWLNPPYSRGLIGDFADAVAAKYEAGEIRQACVLVNNASDTEWFHRLLSACSAVCLLKGRIRFRGGKTERLSRDRLFSTSGHPRWRLPPCSAVSGRSFRIRSTHTSSAKPQAGRRTMGRLLTIARRSSAILNASRKRSGRRFC